MQPIHILLVEDNEGDILLTTEALHEGRITKTITVVKDGWSAIQCLEKSENYRLEKMPDLILLDISLPKMNGFEVLQYVKSSEQFKHIPVIMLTTSTAEIDIYTSYQNYANCYIIKPAEIHDFLIVVASIENFWFTNVQLPHKIRH